MKPLSHGKSLFVAFILFGTLVPLRINKLMAADVSEIDQILQNLEDQYEKYPARKLERARDIQNRFDMNELSAGSSYKVGETPMLFEGFVQKVGRTPEGVAYVELSTHGGLEYRPTLNTIVCLFSDRSEGLAYRMSRGQKAKLMGVFILKEPNTVIVGGCRT